MAICAFPKKEPHHAHASKTANTLIATLAFEAIVDAMLAFHVRVGEVKSNVIPATVRQQYREAVAAMLNAMDPVENGRAAGAAAAVIATAHVDGGARVSVDDILRAVQAYHRHLQSTPIAGVGQLR